MVDDKAAIEKPIREFILAEFLPGEDPAALNDSTALVTTGILDSIATLKLVAFLEKQFHITIAAQETDVDHINTVADMTRMVRSKLAPR